ncbi:MAG: hypothetical protein NC299_12770, partial [Lachnospiraceae bacterium]|nr:hypothetical protein [Lachnospiraceae bacterium]
MQLNAVKKAAALFFVIVTALSLTKTAYGADDLESVYKAVGETISSRGAPSVGSAGGEWAVIGAARSGLAVPEEYYENVVAYVREHADENGRLHYAKSTDNSRVILALTALGRDVTDVGGVDLLHALSDIDYVQRQGINGSIWALIALDSRGYDALPTTREELVGAILNAQLPDGGWNLSGTSADPDVTAMALTALAPYYAEERAAVDAALARLSELQLDSG